MAVSKFAFIVFGLFAIHPAQAAKMYPHDRVIGDQVIGELSKPFPNDRVLGDIATSSPPIRDKSSFAAPGSTGVKSDLSSNLSPTTELQTLPSTKIALIIGNSEYQHSTILKNSTNDAEAIAKRLQEIGFEVILAINVDRSAFEIHLREFAKKIEGSTVSLLYYAGHGIQVEGKNYLIPVEARIEDRFALEFELISVERVLELMTSGSKAAILFLDSCRDNPLARSFASKQLPSRSVSIGRGMAQVDTSGTGALIGFATSPGDVAQDGSGDHSPFAEALLFSLEEPTLEIEQLMKRVKARVVSTTGGRQRPWTSSDLTQDVSLSQ